ncbi:MAG TPA: hypothetical protein VF989_11655 [Polyangiaceae bacterium]|jgi:hypothetical protein
MSFSKQPLETLCGPGLVSRRLSVLPAEEVFLKGIVEASEGVAALYTVGSGQLMAVAPESRAWELDELLADMSREVRSLSVAE